MAYRTTIRRTLRKYCFAILWISEKGVRQPSHQNIYRNAYCIIYVIFIKGWFLKLRPKRILSLSAHSLNINSIQLSFLYPFLDASRSTGPPLFSRSTASWSRHGPSYSNGHWRSCPVQSCSSNHGLKPCSSCFRSISPSFQRNVFSTRRCKSSSACGSMNVSLSGDMVIRFSTGHTRNGCQCFVPRPAKLSVIIVMVNIFNNQIDIVIDATMLKHTDCLYRFRLKETAWPRTAVGIGHRHR